LTSGSEAAPVAAADETERAIVMLPRKRDAARAVSHLPVASLTVRLGDRINSGSSRLSCREPEVRTILRSARLRNFGFKALEEAIEMHNAVGAGLASSIFTRDLRETEHLFPANAPPVHAVLPNRSLSA
jgi:hypothetical protein